MLLTHLLALGVVIALVAFAATRIDAAYGHGCQAQGGCCVVGGCRDETIANSPIFILVVAGSAGAMLFILNGGLEQREGHGAITNLFSLKHSRAGR